MYKNAWIQLRKFYERKTVFPYPSLKTCVLGAQKNGLIEMVLLSIHNMFWMRNKDFQYTLLSGA